MICFAIAKPNPIPLPSLYLVFPNHKKNNRGKHFYILIDK